MAKTVIDPKAFIDGAESWLSTNVLTADVAVQGAVLVLAFLIGTLVQATLGKRLATAIDSLKIPARTRRILRNAGRLVLPLTAFLVLLPLHSAFTEKIIPFQYGLIDAAQGLLLAWIAIRLLVQFIGNAFARNTIALSVWVIAALGILGILGETAHLLDSFGMNIGQFRLSALTVAKAIFALFLTIYLARNLSRLIEIRVHQIKGLSLASRVLISKIVNLVLLCTAILIGIATAGVDLSLLAVFSGAVGLGVGFGLQRGISNLFSGMMLLFDRSIQPGDVIELPGSTFGVVKQMGARYVEVVTRDNKSYLIPNEDLVTSQVVNWSHGDTLVRLAVPFGVDYRHNPHDVIKIAVEAAKSVPRVVPENAPLCHFTGFGESSLDFSLCFWIQDADKGITNVRGEILLALWDAFQKHNISIPYPHREVLLTEVKKAG